MVAMDVVEVSPPYDSGNNITALFAHRCVLEALTGTAMRRLGLTARDYLDETAGRGPAVPTTPTVSLVRDALGYDAIERRGARRVVHWAALYTDEAVLAAERDPSLLAIVGAGGATPRSWRRPGPT